VSIPVPRRGEVWWADLPDDKRRPVLVLTRDPMGAILHSVICAPVTTTARGVATEIPIGTAEGLPHPSVANFDNTLLVSRSLLIRRLGRASAQKMVEACEALAIAVGCDF